MQYLGEILIFLCIGVWHGHTLVLRLTLYVLALAFGCPPHSLVGILVMLSPHVVWVLNQVLYDVFFGCIDA